MTKKYFNITKKLGLKIGIKPHDRNVLLINLNKCSFQLCAINTPSIFEFTKK